MKIASILSFALLAHWGSVVYAQPNAVGVRNIDTFTLACEVVRNRELRRFVNVSDETNEKIRKIVNDPVNDLMGKKTDSFQNLRLSRNGRMAELDESFLAILKTEVPEYNAKKVRAWALKSMFRVPEVAFSSGIVRQFLELDGFAIKSLEDALASEPIPFEELRNRLRVERAKAVIEDLPIGAQVLFVRYAGSKLLNKFEQVADQEGPLELVCYAIEWTNTMVHLCHNPALHKHLQLSEEQVMQVQFIDAQADEKIFAVQRRDLKNSSAETTLMRKRSIADAFAILTEKQLKRLQQWIADEFFVANPKRELSMVALRNYLGLNDKDDWESCLRLLAERDAQLDTRLEQLNSMIVAKILAVLPAQNREDARKLVLGAW